MKVWLTITVVLDFIQEQKKNDNVTMTLFYYQKKLVKHLDVWLRQRKPYFCVSLFDGGKNETSKLKFNTGKTRLQVLHLSIS